MNRRSFVSLVFLIVLLVAQLSFLQFSLFPSVYATTEFAAVNMTSVHTCPLDNHTFVVAYSDDSNDDFSFQIYDTNGTQVLAETDVDTTSGGTLSYTSIGVSAFNSTTFIIGWYDFEDQDATFAVYNTAGTLLSGPTDADDAVGTVGYSVQVSCFNSTHFVIGWFDSIDYDVTFAVYDSSSNLISGPIDADTDASSSYSVSVSTFNSTTFVIGWYDYTGYDVTFAVYNSAGTQIGSTVDADTDVGAASLSVSVSALNSTHFVIGWYDYTDQDATFAVYDSTGTLKTGPTDADDAVGTTSYSVQVSALNSTTFVISWYDVSSTDKDLSFATYLSDGTPVCALTDIESWPTSANSPFRKQSPCSQETGTGIKLYNDNWIIAYANTTIQAIWKAYHPDGTTWDGATTTPDTDAPTFGTISTNTTIAGNPCQFSCYWVDNVGLSGYIFSWNNGTQWYNETWTDPWTGTPTIGWSNTTETLPNPQTWIQNKFYCNDTSNLWNVTQGDADNAIETPRTYFMTNTTTSYSDFGTNTTLSDSTAEFYVYFSDNIHNLDWCGFSWTLLDDVWTDWETVWNDKGASTSWANVTKTLPTELEVFYFYRFKVNNTQGWELTVTSSRTNTTWPTNRYPTNNVTLTSINSTRPNTDCEFSTYWTSNVSLTGYVFGFNDGTGWVNDTEVSLSGTESWANATKLLPDATRRVTRWRFYVWDSSDRVERMKTETLVVTGSVEVINYNTSSAGAAFNARLSSQKKTVYWGGRHWIFTNLATGYGGSGSVNASYTSSVDGETWENWTQFIHGGMVSASAYFDIVVNDTGFIHALSTGLQIYYRAGQMYLNGTIIFTGEQQTIYEFPVVYSWMNNDPFIILDSSGNPCVTVMRTEQWMATEYDSFYRQQEWAIFSTSSNGTWVMRSGFPKLILEQLYFHPDGTPPVVWAIPLSVGNDVYFVSCFGHSIGYAIQPLYISYWNHTTNEISSINQLSEEEISSTGFAVFAAIPINNTRIAYAYVTESHTIKYGEYENGARLFEVELWHDVASWKESSLDWYDDSSSPVIVYDDVTNSVFVIAASVHRPNEIVLKKRSFATEEWSPEITYANEAIDGMAKDCSVVNGWWTNQGILGLLYTTNPNNVSLRYLFINTTSLLVAPTYSDVGTDGMFAYTNIQFATKWQNEYGLQTAYFYWNWTGTMELNGTVNLEGQVEAWSNFTGYLQEQDIVWKIVCEDIYGNLVGVDLQFLNFHAVRNLSQTINVGLNSAQLFEWIETAIALIGIALATSRLAGFSGSAAQSFNMGFGLGRIAEFTRNLSQTISVVMSGQRLIDVLRAASQTVTFGLQAVGERIALYLRDVALAISTSFQSSRLAERFKTVSQLLSVVLQSARLSELWRTATQTIGTSLTVSSLKDIAIATSLLLGISIVTLKLAEYVRATSQTFNVGFAVASLAGFYRGVSQAITATLNAQRLIEVVRLASEAIMFSLQSIGERVGIYVRNAILTVTLAVQGSRLAELFKTVSQSISVTFGTVKLDTFARGVAQTISVVLNGDRTVELFRSVSQIVTLTLLGIGDKTGIYLRNVALTITTVVQGSRLVEWLKSASQTLSMMFGTVRLEEFARTASQTVALAFGSVGEKLGNYTANVALTITTAFQNSRLVEWTKQASQTLSLSLTTSRIAGLLAIAILTITATLNTTYLLNFARQASQTLSFLFNGERIIEVSRVASQTIALTLHGIGEQIGNYFRNAILTLNMIIASTIPPPTYTQAFVAAAFIMLMFIGLPLALLMLSRRK